MALEEGDFDMALQLIPSINSVVPPRLGPEQLTPLHYACQHGRLDVVELLVEQHQYDMQELSSGVPTPLHIAAKYGHVNIVQYLQKVRCNASFERGITNPLHLAAQSGHVTIVQILFDANPVRSSVPDADGNTPLHHASAHGQLDVVTFLSNVAKHPLCPKNRKGETPMHVAAKRGHFDTVKFFVDEKQCDPCSKDGKIGCTPLHYASKCGSLEIVQYLTNEKNCNAECKTSVQSRRKSSNVTTGMTPLHYATFSGHLEIATFLVKEQQCNPQCTDELGFTPLHLACQQGHLELVKFFLELETGEVNLMVTEDGKTPLHSAALGGNLEVVKLLVNSGCDASKVDSEGRIALHYASRNGCTDIMRFLIEEKSCNVNSPDQSGVTPLHQAAQYGHSDTVSYLVSLSQCSPSSVEENGYTALHLAANKGHVNIVELLVKHKYISVTVRDKIGRTPLHHAAQSGHLNVVQFLTSQPDCDPSCQDKSLKATPLHLASSFGHTDVVRYLVNEKGCSSTCTDKFNSTPIHRAAGGGHLEIMQFLVKEKQCSCVVRNKFGNTPLHLACQKGHVEMVKLLLSFSTENVQLRNQVGRMPLDLTENLEIVNEFLKLGVDPSKGSITTRYAYLRYWETLYPMVKVFLLGDTDSGKSTLIKAIQGGSILTDWMSGKFQRTFASDAITAGINPMSVESRHFGKIVIYDFAGHPSYHAGHSAILNVASQQSTPLFLVAIDLRMSSDQIEQRVAYWASLISSSMIDPDIEPQIIVIGSHEDELSKEEYRHKPVILEKVTASTNHNVKFIGWVIIDCRRPASNGMTKLKQLISQKCYPIRSQLTQGHQGSLLRSFVEHKFPGTIVIELRELKEYISHADIPDIKEESNLLQACEMLHTRGYMLFLRNSQSLNDSWIILNQRAILSLVHSFQMQINETNNLGLVPISQLEKTLGSSGFNITLVIRYFLRMEFCARIADRKVLHTIAGFDPPYPLEDHLFFPHLITNKSLPDVWKLGDNWTNQFGWCMECIEQGHFLGPRFLQILLLRLAVMFPFNTNPNSQFVTRRLFCHLWENGIAWVDTRGIETVITVIQQSRALVFLTRLKKGTSFELEHTRFRSLILKEIRSIKEGICPRIKTMESVLCLPPEKSEQCIFFAPEVETHPLFGYRMEEITKVIMNQASQYLSADHQILKPKNPSSESEHEHEHFETAKLGDVLCLEAYYRLQPEVLQNIFESDLADEDVSDADICSIGESLAKRNLGMSTLATMLLVPQTVVQTVEKGTSVSVTEKYAMILRRWRERTGCGTYTNLRQVFDHYSVLAGTDLMVGCGYFPLELFYCD